MKDRETHPLPKYGFRNGGDQPEPGSVKLPKGRINTEGIRAESYDASTNMLEVEWSRGARVLINTWEGPAFEELDMSPEAVDMSRLQTGRAPVLDNHNRWGKTGESQVGVIESARLANGVGSAVIRLSKRDSLKEFVQDVADGIIQNVSVGYKRIEVRQMDDDEETGYPVYRVTKWQPNEISFTPVGADIDSAVRGEESDLTEIKLINKQQKKKGNKMKLTAEEQRRLGVLLAKRNLTDDEETELNGLKNRAEKDGLDLEALEAEAARSDEENPAKVPVASQAKRTENGISESEAQRIATEAIRSEQQRSRDIRDAVRSAGLDDEFADTLIDENKDINAARAEILKKFSEGDPHKGSRNAGHLGAGGAGSDFKATAVEGLRLRSDSRYESELAKTDDGKKIMDNARGIRSMTLVELARESLHRLGVGTRTMDKMELVGRAITQTGSDFPVILQGVIHKTLLAAYTNVDDTWARFCATGEVSDFRKHKRIRPGSFNRLSKITESGEYKNMTIPDGEQEEVSADTFGNTINISRKAIINDDLNFFVTVAQMLGRAAYRSIELDVYALLALNSNTGPTLVDGNPLFHADHSNITAPSAVTVDGVDAARVLMAKQKDVSGNDFIGLRPSIWLGPIEIGGNARVVNNSTYDPDAANKLQRANKVANIFSDIVDTAQLTDVDRWYTFADPAVEPVIEVSFLNGNRTPFMEQDEPFNVDGMQWKIRHDYGVGAVGYRGVTMTPSEA